MAYLEPSAPQGPGPFRAPSDSRSAWLALAEEIEPQVAHYFLVSARCGCFMQAARSFGVASIAQGALAARSKFLRRWFALPPERLVLCGISFGYEDAAHPANGFRTTRAPLAEVARWIEE